MEYFVLTVLGLALIITGVTAVLITQGMFDRAFEKKLPLVYQHISNFVNAQTKDLQEQIDKLKKRGKCGRCKEDVPTWDEVTDPGFGRDKQVSRQCGGNTWPEGPECDPSQEGP